MYSTTFQNQDVVETLSRYFETKKAASTWFKWLLKQRFVKQVSLYRGQPGEELLKRKVV